MHESGYFPHLPLNLFISARAQSFGTQGSEWLATGLNWSRSTHCWSLHFPPTSGWYRWFFIYLKLSYLLYYLPSYCQCWNFYCFYIFEAFISKSWRFILFSTTQWLIPIFPHPFFVHCSHSEVHDISRILFNTRKEKKLTKKTTQVDFLKKNLRYF